MEERESLENMNERAIYTIVEKAKKYDALVKPYFDNKLHCSFCGITQDRVEVLIAGPNAVYICSECVKTCNNVLADHKRKETANWSSFRQVDGDRKIVIGIITEEDDISWRIKTEDGTIFAITKEAWKLLDE